jgi:hypothetical protein
MPKKSGQVSNCESIRNLEENRKASNPNAFCCPGDRHFARLPITEEEKLQVKRSEVV